MAGFSIIVCCYNSSKRLPETIAHFSKLDLNDDNEIEVIIVDNASTDDTTTVAIEEGRKFKGLKNYTVLKELTPGKSSALRKGIREAKYEYIIICDDDNWLDADYITEAAKLMQKYPTAGVIGGLSVAAFELGTKPDWFDDYHGVYAIGSQYPNDGIITKEKGYVFGAGSVWRTSVLLAITETPQVLTCRVGNKLSSAGDTELCYKAIILGYDIVYSSKLKFTHFMPAARLTKAYIKRFYEDSAPDMVHLHGLLYQSGIQQKMFNSSIKRTWWGQALAIIKNTILNKNNSFKLSYIQFKELCRMNWKYDKSFK
ncbi:glycosyltransferase family A protein [Mucilaginibacter sp. L196]|uniref:glycosyltransferase family A protein n=1 Tax=Mucilaginibacter sp. L196 TaxID=1641870 RepID=UPI00131D408A|nr:glycosyltransferase family A protein [Mucilaginibacter sp. L196]